MFVKGIEDVGPSRIGSYRLKGEIFHVVEVDDAHFRFHVPVFIKAPGIYLEQGFLDGCPVFIRTAGEVFGVRPSCVDSVKDFFQRSPAS